MTDFAEAAFENQCSGSCPERSILQTAIANLEAARTIVTQLCATRGREIPPHLIEDLLSHAERASREGFAETVQQLADAGLSAAVDLRHRRQVVPQPWVPAIVAATVKVAA